MLRIQDLTYRVAGRTLLERAEANIDAGHRVGLVGPNGTGKTTLLRLIAGELQPDGGRIDLPPRWRIGLTHQEAPGGSANLLDTVLAADADLARLTAAAESEHDPHRLADIHERLQARGGHAAPARAARILAGLGFDAAAQARPCSSFSGGWRMRVALAGLLFAEPDLLLLDEPTNHLDLEAGLWLEDYLRRYPGTVLVVSHDRDLLNRVVDEILHLENCRLTHYRGNYDRFATLRRQRLELDEKMRRKQAAQRAHIQQFVDRFRYKASKSRQAQSRLKMLERMEPIADAGDEYRVTFGFPEPEPLAPPLYSLDGATVGYDGRPVLSQLSLRLDPDDRIALLGANGNGKSTFAKLLAGRLEPMSGQVVRPSKLRVGYFAQHQFEELDLAATPLVELQRRRPRDSNEQLRAQLGRFGFSQARAETRVGSLSGGEKARLVFALITCDRPHILVLDEPTNHLDVESREALVQAINGFAGAVVIVSHDPHVVELTADRLWLVRDGTVAPFEGDFHDYRALIGRGSGGDRGDRPAADKADRRAERREAAERRQALAPLKKQVAEIERRVARLEGEKLKLQATLADTALYENDPARATELQKQLGALAKELAAAEAEWLERQAALEKAQTASA